MSDLISRSALIKELNNKNITFDARINDIIMNQPTAYDVDAVVKELEDSVVCGMFGAMFGKSDTEIIDIIRKGGAERDFLLGSYNR